MADTKEEYFIPFVCQVDSVSKLALIKVLVIPHFIFRTFLRLNSLFTFFLLFLYWLVVMPLGSMRPITEPIITRFVLICNISRANFIWLSTIFFAVFFNRNSISTNLQKHDGR